MGMFLEAEAKLKIRTIFGEKREKNALKRAIGAEKELTEMMRVQKEAEERILKAEEELRRSKAMAEKSLKGARR